MLLVSLVNNEAHFCHSQKKNVSQNTDLLSQSNETPSGNNDFASKNTDLLSQKNDKLHYLYIYYFEIISQYLGKVSHLVDTGPAAATLSNGHPKFLTLLKLLF